MLIMTHLHHQMDWIFKIHLSLKHTFLFCFVYRLLKIYTKLVSLVILVQRLTAFHRELICMLVTLSAIDKHENVSYCGNNIYLNHYNHLKFGTSTG